MTHHQSKPPCRERLGNSPIFPQSRPGPSEFEGAGGGNSPVRPTFHHPSSIDHPSSPVAIPQHEHLFGATQVLPAERRTRWVILLTLVMMVAEVVSGTLFGSMALLADGWHMATHAAALGITAFAYAFARRHASNPRFSFGTGKVGALGGFGSAVSLALVALLVLWESLNRFWEPVEIRFEEAIGVAVIGLLVNLASAWLLHDTDHGHGHEHGHKRLGHTEPTSPQLAVEARAHHLSSTCHPQQPPPDGRGGDLQPPSSIVHHPSAISHPSHEHHDHNLRGAYLHVLADAVTSVAAIVALVVGKLVGWTWMDAASGVLGAVVISIWAIGLMRSSSAVLLDNEVSPELRQEVLDALQAEPGTEIIDLHLWCVGVGKVAAIVSLRTSSAQTPDSIRSRLTHIHELVHITIELNPA